YQVSAELALEAEIVLINVRRPQTRLNKEDSATTEWKESRRPKINVFCGRTSVADFLSRRLQSFDKNRRQTRHQKVAGVINGPVHFRHFIDGDSHCDTAFL